MPKYQVVDRGVEVRGIPRIHGETLTLSQEDAQQFGQKLRPVRDGNPASNNNFVQPNPNHSEKTETKTASTNKRSSRYDGWGLPSSSGWLGRGPDSEVRGDLRKSRDRAFDVSLDDRFAKKVVDTLVNNVVGKGIRLQSKVSKQRGGDLDEKLNRQLEEAWQEWLDRQYCHTAGLQHFYEIQKTAFSSCVTAGEMFVRFVRQPFGGSKIPLSLETIESAQMPVEEYLRTHDGHQIRMGVEVDDWLRPRNYWFYQYHPGEYWADYHHKGQQYRGYPGEDIVHLYALRRLNQHRGLSWLRATQEPLKNLAGFNEAYLYAARVGACVAGILQSDYPDMMSPEEAEEATDDNGAMRPIGKIEPGTFYKLPKGESFQGFDPKRPESAYEPFIRAQLRGIAAGSNMTYEELSADYSQANYSSIRQSHVIAITYWQQLQDWFCREFLDPIYREFLEAMFRTYPSMMAGFPMNPQRFCGQHAKQWVTRGWSWVDPLKEVTAVEKSLNLGLTSLTEEASKQGRDFQDTIQSRAREIKLAQQIAEKEGIPLEMLMNNAAQSAIAPNPEDES